MRRLDAPSILEVRWERRDDAASESIRRRLAEAGFAVAAIRPIVPSLEDVFIDLLAASRTAADTETRNRPPIGATDERYV